MSLERIAALANLLIEQEDRVAVLEEDLKNAKAAAMKTKLVDMPELMLEFGLTSFTMTSGQKIDIKEDVQCAITEAMRPRALAWLREHGFGGLIKTIVSVEFDRGAVEEAEQLAIRLNEEGVPAFAEEKVHAMTLKSFVTEQLEAGHSIPFDLFGVRPFNIAKVTNPKK